MRTAPSRQAITRREALRAAGLAGAATLATSRTGAAGTEPDDDEVVRRVLGGPATPSSRVRLLMPPAFGNGYSVPLSLEVDSPMTDADHVRQVHLIAPKNPLVLVAAFTFTPRCGRVAIDTRIRLAEPQYVFAVARMGDGALLSARAWVKVDSNGCN